MFVSPATLDYARQLLGDDGRPTLTLIPQASAQSSSWVPERMAEVLRHARDVLGFRVFLDGTAAQAATIEGIIAASGGPAVSLAGRTSLRQVAAVCGLSDLVVGVDTGTTHIAKAVGVPTVVLMPSWEQPHNWHALPQPAVALLYKGTGARVASGYAMEDLTVEDVLAAAQRLLASFPPSEEARSVRVARMLHERLPAD
jgi:ADP-heptose:LPS heptosyltransferase